MKQLKAYFIDTQLSVSITIDSETAFTYTKEFNSGGLSLSYTVNAVADTLPFTLVATDVLEINSDGEGFVELT